MPASFIAAGGLVVEAEPLADWVIATLALAGAFRLGSGLASRRATALAGVVRAFAEEAAAWRDATEDGEITDEEAHVLAGAVDRFFTRVAALGWDLLEDGRREVGP